MDCDVHHNFHDPEQLLPYLPKFYQEHLHDQGLHLPGSGYANTPFRRTRPDIKDPALKERDFNFSLEFMQKELLDRWHVDFALLTGPPVFYAVAGLPDPDWAAALCTAFNDWTIEHWLDKDPRVVNAILVAPNDPALAVKEIHQARGSQGHGRRHDADADARAFRQARLPSDLGSLRRARLAGRLAYRRWQSRARRRRRWVSRATTWNRA